MNTQSKEWSKLVEKASMPHVVVVGQGYVGLPLALGAVSAGYRVTGYELHVQTALSLGSGRSHIDDVSDEELGEALVSNYSVTSDPGVISDADVVVVCVPTPLAEEGGPDLTAVRHAAETINRHLSSHTLVILESTTYPGTTEELFAPLILDGNGHLEGIEVAFSPERIDPGNAIFGLANTPKVVGGVSDRATKLAADFYAPFVGQVVVAHGAKEAEMAKLLENTFRHVNIALVNEMLRFSNDLGIDLWNAIDCAETKPFGYMAFRPGPGVGGHCIPVDPTYLSHRVRAKLGYGFRMVELAEEINDAAPLYVGQRLWRALNDCGKALKGARVLLAGVTYKPDISDRRESPAVPLAQYLLSMGAEVSYSDPHVQEWRLDESCVIPSAADLYQAAEEADAVVLLQNHAAFDVARMCEAAKILIDTRGVADPRHDSVVRL